MRVFVHRLSGLLVPLVAGALLLGACGTSSPAAGGGGTSSSSTASPGSSTPSTGNSTTPSTSGGSVSAASSIEAALQNGETATFDATYKISGSPTVQTFEIVTAGSTKFAWTSTQTSGAKNDLIVNGTNAWACNTAAGSSTVTCEEFPISEASSLTAAYTVFTGKFWYDDIASLQAKASSEGVHTSTSTQTIAGQSASCLSWSGGTSADGQGGEVCVTAQGVLAYAHATGAPQTLTLESYSGSVSGSAFQPPSGATVQTIPGGTLP